MARIRKSKANTKNFEVIPLEHEREDAELLKKKYGNKRLFIPKN
jgi:hypothetical protein